MHDINGTILNLSSGTTKTGKTYWDVAFSDGKAYRAWDAPLAQTAQNLVGQAVIASVDITQNGQYTNYGLKAVRAANGSAPAAVQQPLPTPTPAPQSGGRSPEVEARIVRQSSMATAFNFVGHVLSGSGDVDTATAHALDLAKRLFQHAFYGDPNPSQTPQNGSEVAAQVNQVLEGAVSVGATTPTPDW